MLPKDDGVRWSSDSLGLFDGIIQSVKECRGAQEPVNSIIFHRTGYMCATTALPAQNLDLEPGG